MTCPYVYAHFVLHALRAGRGIPPAGLTRRPARTVAAQPIFRFFRFSEEAIPPPDVLTPGAARCAAPSFARTLSGSGPRDTNSIHKRPIQARLRPYASVAAVWIASEK